MKVYINERKKRKGEKEKHKRQDDESYVEGRKRQMTKSQ